MANDKAKSLQERIVEGQVAKRKSVDVDGKVYGPGSKLTLPLSEAMALRDLGFIVEPDYDDDDAGAGAGAGNDSGLSVQTGGSDPE